MTDVEGILPVISTPFTADWEIDRPGVRREIDWLFSHGVHGVTVAMVSEVLRLTNAERMTLTEDVVAAVDGRGVVVVSVGAESTDQACGLTSHAVAVGVDAVMANPPLTISALSVDQVLSYYDAIACAADERPLIVQDASGYIGSALDLDTLVKLFNYYGAAKVLFKPEAQPLGARLSALLERTGGMARVFEGSGGLALLDNFRRGVVGTMPGPDLAWAIVPMWQALVGKDEESAYRIQEGLAPVLSMVSGLDSYIAVEKHLLHRQGVFNSPRQRQPVGFVLDGQTRDEIDRLVDRLAALVDYTPSCDEQSLGA